MPELPEVETVRRKLILKLKGKKINNLTVLHNNVFEGQDVSLVIDKIKGQRINDIGRRGKWLKFILDDYYLLSHLRMEGKYFYRDFKDEINKHELVIFNIDDEFELRYQDVRKFGKMHLISKNSDASPLDNLGFEPFDENLTIKYLKEKYRNKNIPIKSILLDQSIVVGIGNIYADEILFLSKINPYKRGKDLTDEELGLIIENTKKVLSKAISEGGTTIRSYTSEEGVSGLFQNSLNVHQKEGECCPCCNNIIIRDKIGGRSTYYCSNCQKLENYEF